MALFLSFGCADGPFISLDTDIDLLRKGLSVEIARGRIFFPYIFGRELHDKAVELYPEKTSLTHRQAITLLQTVACWGLSSWIQRCRPLRLCRVRRAA
jgi:hypothetical protein